MVVTYGIGIVLYPLSDSAVQIVSFGKPQHKSAFKLYQTISKIFPKPKDQVDKETCDHVYNIPCADCSNRYAGETQRKFITRKGEHQKAVVRREGEKSVLADHVTKTNHDIAWDEATILRTNNNWYQSKILEAWDINCTKDPLNQDNGALLTKEYLHSTLANKKNDTSLLQKIIA